MEDILKSFRKRRRIKWADPGPFDLTLKKVRERMEKIRIGDRINFYSIGECFTLSQLDRHNTSDPVTQALHCSGTPEGREGVCQLLRY